MPGLVKILLFSLLVVSLGCRGASDADMAVYETLDMAGDNRVELRKVLDYYADDTLRLKAAKYLIGNMSRHYSYVDNGSIERYNRSVDSILRRVIEIKSTNIIALIDSVARAMKLDTLDVVSDAMYVKADFLIENIDAAFEMWQTPLCRDLSFEEFCERILPYKIYDLQQLDNWRSRFKSVGDSVLRHLAWGDMTRGSQVDAADTLNQYLRKCYPHTMTDGSSRCLVPLSIDAALNVGVGSCDDYCRIGLAVLRAAGIPAVYDFAPIWGRINRGHSWVSVFNRRGRPVEFTPIADNAITHNIVNGFYPKVYRNTFAANDFFISLNRYGDYVPPMFRNVFLKDVTSVYTTVSQIDIQVVGRCDGFVYLACPFADRWTPVAVAELKGGEASFADMGRGCVYLPMIVEAETLIPVSDPFLLNFDGTTTVFKADRAHVCRAKLTRKYPVRDYVDKAARNAEGSVIECSDSPDFKVFRCVAGPFDGQAEGRDVKLSETIPPYRYWRLLQPTSGKYCAIADLCFDPIDSVMPVRYIGSDSNVSKSFDGDLLTGHICSGSGRGWIGVDFGRPVHVVRAVFTPCGDGNSIDPGDEYELLFWNGNCWQSLGKKIASTVSVDYDNVPAGALLILIDRTKGTEHRLFCLRDSMQEFL